MNYYEHHIRDYDAATSHLTWDEDMAYTRLLRWYYRKEQPIPADIKEACRQVRATSSAQRKAVEAVLREFFDLREDGWHQATCDDAISRFKAGEPEREAKQKNEDTRLARHRIERAELFAVINGAGEHMPWNAPIAEVRAAAERIRSASAATGTATPEPKTATATETAATPPATGTATPATHLQRLPNHQTPDTRHQTPEEGIPSDADASASSGPPAMSAKDRLWTLAQAMLGEQKTWRTFVGKAVATYGEPVVLDGLVQAAAEEPLEPKAWLTKAWEARAKARPAVAPANGHQPQTTLDLLNRDPRPTWVVEAGFPDIFQAESHGCGPGNYRKFREGRRVDQ